MSFITAIGTANPPHRISQTTLADFMRRSMHLHNGAARKLDTIFRASGIHFRHSVLDDYGRTQNFSFYPNEETGPEPSTQKRLNIFREHAVGLSMQAIRTMDMESRGVHAGDITHLVVVCCTGMYAPGLDIDIVKAMGLSSSVQRTCINFMGCYAAFNALKLADAFCKSESTAKVLVVCTELCSLHFQREGTDDNLLANALFGDGAAAMLVEASSESPIKLHLRNFYSDLAVEGETDMAWTVGDLGFEMKLSSYVPDIIKGGIRKLTTSLLERIALELNDIRYFAIHPGGKKILEVIEQELGITRHHNDAAYAVLRDFGNMSSPTVIFVLDHIRRKLTTADHGQHILSFAFGPGLTLESMVLEIDVH